MSRAIARSNFHCTLTFLPFNVTTTSSPFSWCFSI